MSQNGTGSTSNIKIQNFLEALRSSQTKSFPQNNSESSHGINSFSELQRNKEIESKRIEQFHNQRSHEWNKVFSSKEVQKERKIDQIRQDLQNLSKQVRRLDTNLTKAVQAPVVEGGDYDENFLDHLKRSIRLFALDVTKTNSWLEVYQNRSRKQGVYRTMASSKGSSFTQNNERAVATSIG